MQCIRDIELFFNPKPVQLMAQLVKEAISTQHFQLWFTGHTCFFVFILNISARL